MSYAPISNPVDKTEDTMDQRSRQNVNWSWTRVNKSVKINMGHGPSPPEYSPLHCQILFADGMVEELDAVVLHHRLQEV